MTVFYIDPVNGDDTKSGLTWAERWKTFAHAGTVMVTGDELLTQSPANFTQYCTRDDVKKYPGSPITDATDDTEIDQIVAAVLNWMDTTLEWSFQSETRTNEEIAYPHAKVDADGYLQIRVDKCPVQSVASVAYRYRPNQSWVAIDPTLIEVYPTPATAQRPLANSNLIKCYTALGRNDRPRVQVTYTGGFTGPTPPAALNWLAVRLCWWRFKQRSAPFEKEGNPAMGIIVIPQSLPPDLKRDLMLWKRFA